MEHPDVDRTARRGRRHPPFLPDVRGIGGPEGLHDPHVTVAQGADRQVALRGQRYKLGAVRRERREVQRPGCEAPDDVRRTRGDDVRDDAREVRGHEVEPGVRRVIGRILGILNAKCSRPGSWPPREPSTLERSAASRWVKRRSIEQLLVADDRDRGVGARRHSRSNPGGRGRHRYHDRNVRDPDDRLVDGRGIVGRAVRRDPEVVDIDVVGSGDSRHRLRRFVDRRVGDR